jgi:hypothetical protein
LADRDRHLAIEVFLHQPGSRGGGIELLIFVHYPQAHQHDCPDGGEQRQTDSGTDHEFDHGETTNSRAGKTTQS